ncbi:hypothetical protein BaRGS_00037632 [Batillaria attramentaria]|uniref:C-type lectin domain-containing protein n=1 Tax=Batillaria attramentaria TaxID=370345 RepID=A0ABD0J887_9CAEN
MTDRIYRALHKYAVILHKYLLVRCYRYSVKGKGNPDLADFSLSTDIWKFFLIVFAEHQRGGKCSDALCPTGAIRFGCQCYMFVLHERMKWEDARGYCHRMGGSLLYVGSQGVSKNIKRFVKGNLGRRGMQKVNFYTCLIHTTAHDSNPAYLEQHKGSKRADGWYWQRGIGLKNKPLDKNIGDKFWAAKISNDHVSAGFEPSCMVLNGTDTFKWHAVYCSSENNFICEWKATPVRRTRKGKRRKSEDTETGENRRTKGDTTRQQKGGQEDGEAMSDDETGLENKKSKENVRDSERENG